MAEFIKTAASFVQGARTLGREYYTSPQIFAREMERRNKQATREFLGRWNEAEKEARAKRKKRTGTD